MPNYMLISNWRIQINWLKYSFNSRNIVEWFTNYQRKFKYVASEMFLKFCLINCNHLAVWYGFWINIYISSLINIFIYCENKNQWIQINLYILNYRFDKSQPTRQHISPCTNKYPHTSHICTHITLISLAWILKKCFIYN